MRSKTTLSFIEQIIMICVFAVAAAVSLRVFVYAEDLSAKKETKDFAVTESQNAAECIKSCAGDMRAAAEMMAGEVREGGFSVSYNANYQVSKDDPTYLLEAVRRDSDNINLGVAQISVSGEQGKIYSLLVYWQEAME